MSISEIWAALEQVASSKQVMLSATGAFAALKLFFLSRLAGRSYNSRAIKISALFLSIALVASAFGDLAWVVRTVHRLFFRGTDHLFLHLFVNISWCLYPLVFQFLGLLAESISTKQFRFTLRHYLSIATTSILCTFSGIISLIGISNPEIITTPWIQYFSRHTSPLIGLCLIMLPSLFIASHRLYKGSCPRILRKQLKWLLCGGIIPFWISEFIHVFPIDTSPTWVANSYTLVTISDLLLIFALYYCGRKIIGMRFLDLHDHVKSHTKFQFAQDFITIIDQLGHVTNLKELGHITQRFFKEAFDVPFVKTVLYTRKPDTMSAGTEHPLPAHPAVELAETFIVGHGSESERLAKKHKIFIHDEIAFNQFYRPDEENERLLNFLDAINADIFIPICEKGRIVAFIIVDRLARGQERLYSDLERDEMLIFAGYLGKIINLMQHKNLNMLIKHEKELQEELYRKHREVNQYKESIRSFLRPDAQQSIGILFYKNRRFTFGNQAAKELIPINPNIQEGHPLARDLKKAATAAENYKAPQTVHTKDAEGQHLVLDAVPSLEHNNVFITVSYPRISDIVRRKIDCLKDPSEWDYLLYLETTESGKLINQLIPGSGSTLLSFKIDLLKIALSKKAILLDMPEEDLQPTVELLHHTNLRDTLHVLTLKGKEDNMETGIKLFGANRLFGINGKDPALLETLHETGTLFIKNIHWLSKESQEHLTEYLKYGLYRPIKSNERLSSSVRIICSTNQNLQALVQEGTFSKELFDELRQTSISMPALNTLSDEELGTLAEGFGAQEVETTAFTNLLSLNKRDKFRLCHVRPTSLIELKKRVQQLLAEKSEHSEQSEVHHETQFDSAYGSSDPVVVEAARLGKRVLRDRHLMTQLWSKLKSQSKIATLLDVNRSSVNRRCREFGLIDESDTSEPDSSP